MVPSLERLLVSGHQASCTNPVVFDRAPKVSLQCQIQTTQRQRSLKIGTAVTILPGLFDRFVFVTHRADLNQIVKVIVCGVVASTILVNIIEGVSNQLAIFEQWIQ